MTGAVPPKNDEIRRLVHSLREPVGAFAIHIELLDDQDLNASARRTASILADGEAG